jgi:hypothetical protein
MNSLTNTPVTPSDPNDTALYQRGFNDGYLIAKHAPELSAQLADVQSNSPRMEGMKDGKEKFLLENTKNKEVNKSKNSIGKKERKDINREME